MADDERFRRLEPGMYHVPWPHGLLAEGGVHQAVKFRRFYLIAGIILIVTAAVSIVLGIPTASQYKTYHLHYVYEGTGFWGGCVYAITGMVSLLCAKQVKMQCSVLTSFVLAFSTMGVSGYVCWYEFHQATYFGYKGITSLAALDGIIGFASVIAMVIGLVLALVSGSTLCSCSYGDISVAAAQSDVTILVVN